MGGGKGGAPKPPAYPAAAASIDDIIQRHKSANKPLAVMLAGHNGSGKSTLWYRHLANSLRIPLINADRMMLSILPEVRRGERLPDWAEAVRDTDTAWMRAAQNGVQSFVEHARAQKVPFAQETVFSYWEPRADGSVASKIDAIRDWQAAGYFVLLIFVGLAHAQVSVYRVKSRKQEGGHDVPVAKLLQRFPRTQQAIANALPVADAAILLDNSRRPEQAFTVARVQSGGDVEYDIRTATAPPEIRAWLDVICPAT